MSNNPGVGEKRKGLENASSSNAKKPRRAPLARHEYKQGTVLNEEVSLDETLAELERHCAVAISLTPSEGGYDGPERWTSTSTLYNGRFIEEKEGALKTAKDALKQGDTKKFRKAIPPQKHGLVNSYCDKYAIKMQCNKQLEPILKMIFGEDMVFYSDRFSFKSDAKDSEVAIEDSLHFEGLPGSSYALYLVPPGQWRSVVAAKHKNGAVSKGNWEKSISGEDVECVVHMKFKAPNGKYLLVIQQQWKAHGITKAGMLLAPYLGVITSTMAQRIEEQWNALLTSFDSEKGASKKELWFVKQLHPDLIEKRFPWSAVRMICFLYQYPFPYWGSGKENTQHGTDRSSLGYSWVKDRYDNFQPGTCVPVVDWPIDGTVGHTHEEYRQALIARGLRIPQCVFQSSIYPWRLCPMKMEDDIGRKNMERFGFVYSEDNADKFDTLVDLVHPGMTVESSTIRFPTVTHHDFFVALSACIETRVTSSRLFATNLQDDWRLVIGVTHDCPTLGCNWRTCNYASLDKKDVPPLVDSVTALGFLDQALLPKTTNCTSFETEAIFEFGDPTYLLAAIVGAERESDTVQFSNWEFETFAMQVTHGNGNKGIVTVAYELRSHAPRRMSFTTSRSLWEAIANATDVCFTNGGTELPTTLRVVVRTDGVVRTSLVWPGGCTVQATSCHCELRVGGPTICLE